MEGLYVLFSLLLNVCYNIDFAAPPVDGALGFGIKEDQLTALTRDHNYSALQQYGGVSISCAIVLTCMCKTVYTL
jgi:hypothetical protein